MRKGFTLLEMILVVVLVGALTVFSVPNMRGTWRNVLLRRAAGDAAALMRYAQSRAVLNQSRICFGFDEVAQSYQIRQEGKTESQKVITNRWGRTFRVPAGVICEMTANPLMFYLDGKIDRGRMIFCQDERCFTVSTREQRGRVLLIDGRIE